jgi:hypothetical protein
MVSMAALGRLAGLPRHVLYKGVSILRAKGAVWRVPTTGRHSGFQWNLKPLPWSTQNVKYVETGSADEQDLYLEDEWAFIPKDATVVKTWGVVKE